MGLLLVAACRPLRVSGVPRRLGGLSNLQIFSFSCLVPYQTTIFDPCTVCQKTKRRCKPRQSLFGVLQQTVFWQRYVLFHAHVSGTLKGQTVEVFYVTIPRPLSGKRAPNARPFALWQPKSGDATKTHPYERTNAEIAFCMPHNGGMPYHGGL